MVQKYGEELIEALGRISPDKNKRWRHRNRAAGFCPRCGKRPEKGVICNECKEKKNTNSKKNRDLKNNP